MKLRDQRQLKTPELMIIPMIDIIFFLLVFFMLGTLSMIEQKSIPVKLPVAQNANIDTKTNFAITIKKDGSLYLEDKPMQLSSLVQQAKVDFKSNPDLAIVIRADKDIEYGTIISLIDTFKSVGIHRFGLATDKAGSQDD